MWKSGNEHLILNMKHLSISGSVEMWKSGNEHLKGHCHGDFNAFREKVLKLVNRSSRT